jgi:hypothetical protein
MLLVLSMNTTHTTTRKIGSTELISTIRSLHISHFLLHTSPIKLVVQGRMVHRKR